MSKIYMKKRKEMDFVFFHVEMHVVLAAWTGTAQ